ncbi:MAG: hypothetical protein EA370_17805 [Wenzhouxiangella sp.]|nr:MAG: hypothetical protein EA370_17805 [Wenzhouxiangella sp.]
MTIPAEFLPLWLAGLGLPVFLAIFIWNLIGSPWQLLKQNGLHNLYSLATVLLAGLWWLKAGAHAGLEFHLLGLTTMVLIFGWRLALVAGSTALVLVSILSGQWLAIGINGLIGVVMPVFVANALHHLIYQRMPRHFFVYVLVAAHFSSMVVIGSVIIAGGLAMWLLGVHPWDRVVGEFLIFMPLVLIPEGFLNGAIMTTLILLRPEWVRSFDDRDYIDGK